MIRPLYKAVEPFMEVPKGFGYLGVIQYDDEEDKVQCHICGKWFSSLPAHLRKHDITSEDYRDEYGLPIKGGLLSLGCAKHFSELASRPENMKRIKWHLKNWGKKHPYKRNSATRKALRMHKIARNTMAFKNKKGLCDLQIKARYEIVRKIVGHPPSKPEIRKYDGALGGKLTRMGFNKWKKKNGLKTLEPGNPFGNINLISYLRKWSRNYKRRRGNISVSYYDQTRNKSYPCGHTYIQNFGSWQNALTQAGLK